MESSAGAPSRLAIVDRDTGFLQVLVKRLERLGWEHRVLADAPEVDELVALRVTAVVVDAAVVGGRDGDDGGAWLERTAAALPALGIVVCSAGSSVAERVRGLRLGADDWVSKPCHPEEVIARVEAVVRRGRRAAQPPAAPARVAGEIEIRADQFQAFRDGRSLDLTRREFELLDLLAAAEGRVLEREQVYQRVWGYAMARGDRSVDVFVRKLRQKLEKASPGWRYIHTHFGVGYRFAPEGGGERGAEEAAPEAVGTGEPELVGT